MPRRGTVDRHRPSPDPKFGSLPVQMFINKIMTRGKKATAERIVYDAFAIVEDRLKRPALDVFDAALRNVTPVLEVKPRRVGGATYQVPVDIRAERRTSLAMRWMVTAARARRGRSMAEKLADEISDAANGQGATMKKKEDTHRMAEANRAFVHYRW
ncbi:MAG: 30S ribosomal protein S7 [Dehalococcoidia bacterium]